MNKYISIDDIREVVKNNDFIDSNMSRVIKCGYLTDLANKAKPMVSVEDVENIIRYINSNTDSALKLTTTSILLRELINPKPKKYACFTSSEWDQLNKLAFVTIEIHSDIGDTNVFFLDEFMNQCGELEEIKFLRSDPENMERTSKDIPNGIKVKYTWGNGDTKIAVTPEYITGNWTHYRILGVDGYE